MAFFKSGNPTITEKAFEKSLVTDTENVMTVRGTMNKFGFLFLMVMATAFYTWNAFNGGQDITMMMYGGGIAGFVVAIVIVFKQSWAAYLAPAYALLKGLFIGGISAYFSAQFAEVAPNLIIQAVSLTFGTAIAMFALYYFKVIKAAERFKSIIITATMGIFFFYLIAIVLGFFGIQIPFIHEGGTFGIIFSLVVVAIAALNLILDFDMIEKGAAMGAPKHMEWYGAFGLLVTIIWLYLEILRLLAKLNSRD